MYRNNIRRLLRVFVPGDLLENYCPDDDLISAARIFFGISILLTYPLDCFVAREIIGYSFFDVTNTLTKNQHFFITFLLVFISYLISVSTDCLGIVLELNVRIVFPLVYKSVTPRRVNFPLDFSIFRVF